ncbi:5706_t:CDS:2 [Gigaspora rosea]|nr:5706_t:CDS:2 [Gigaspora rosea]
MLNYFIIIFIRDNFTISDNHKSELRRKRAAERSWLNYQRKGREQQRKRRDINRAKRRKTYVEKDIEAKEANTPLRILELNNSYDLLKNRDSTDSDEEIENETDDEMFTITNSGKKITPINLRIDYTYRGEQLKNICLYDYVATIHK